MFVPGSLVARVERREKLGCKRTGCEGEAVAADRASVPGSTLRVGPSVPVEMVENRSDEIESWDSTGVPDAPGLNMSAMVTLEAWANPTSLDAGAIGIVERSFFYSLEAVRFLENPAGVGIRTGGLTQSAAMENDLALGSWTHLAGSYEADDAIRLMVDGALVGTTPVGAAQIPNNANDIAIGAGFSGSLDEIRIVGVEHSAQWLAAQHESMTDQLLTFGPASTPPAE